MDPATAFQVACGALQLAEACYKATKTAYEIYKSADGLTSENRRVEHEIQDVEQASSSVNESLKTLQSVGSLPGDQKRLKFVCEDCLELSTRLHGLLNRLKLGKQEKKRHMISKLKDNFVEKNTIKEIRDELGRRQRQLNTDLLITLRYVVFLYSPSSGLLNMSERRTGEEDS